MWWKPGFEGRIRRGATDLVNSQLNYGYGILYSRLMNALVRAGLNVYVGFLHKPQKGKAGLLYDFIEEFRAAAVDRTVFSRLNLGVEARVTEDGLDAQSRRELARSVLQRLQSDTATTERQCTGTRDGTAGSAARTPLRREGTL
jgi:CRISP-associated protein Cas1